MTASRQWGGGSVDCLFFTAVVSASILFTPWYITVGVLLIMVWFSSQIPNPVATRRRCRPANVRQLPSHKPVENHHFRKAA